MTVAKPGLLVVARLQSFHAATTASAVVTADAGVDNNRHATLPTVALRVLIFSRGPRYERGARTSFGSGFTYACPEKSVLLPRRLQRR